MTPLLTFCEEHLDQTVDTIEALVRLESPSTDKTAVDRCGYALATRLRRLGARVDAIPQTTCGDHLRAELTGTQGRVLLLGHFDTVWPVGTLARMPLETREGRLHGPGAFDMKAGIALALTGIEALRASRGECPSIVMLWTTDEEVGSVSSRALIEAEARRADAVLVLEPALPGGALKTSRKGCGEFEVTVTGVAAHAGVDPGKGASAVHELARQILTIERLQDLARGISVNVGVVAGGTRGNVVAEEARAVVDVRVPTREDGRRIEEAFGRLQPEDRRTRLMMKGGFSRPPLERTAAVEGLFRLAHEAASGLGHDLAEGATGGGSDGNFTAALGIPTLDGLGATGDGAHAQHEHVVVADLPWRAALIAALLERLARLG
ncbi:MAG TPA: M20 family metallopeptidase [Vicinamibacterales bacterium]|nr:M20 family metallopeptidase [Vicinamibacterales bacterium]